MIAKLASVAALVLGSLGCSTQQPTVEPALEIPPPEFARDLPLDPPQKLAGGVCQLGASCLEMDERPFEPCLVGTKHCVDKAVQPIPAQGPEAGDPGPVEPRGR